MCVYIKTSHCTLYIYSFLFFNHSSVKLGGKSALQNIKTQLTHSLWWYENISSLWLNVKGCLNVVNICISLFLLCIFLSVFFPRRLYVYKRICSCIFLLFWPCRSYFLDHWKWEILTTRKPVARGWKQSDPVSFT